MRLELTRLSLTGRRGCGIWGRVYVLFIWRIRRDEEGGTPAIVQHVAANA